MRAQIHHPDHLARHALIEQIPHGEEIAQALGHLPALDLQHLVVHPDLREPGPRMGAGRLRQLVLVVRELQINAAAVNVETRPQQCVAHRRAFDVPARPPIAPGAVPSRRGGIRRLPQHEIHRVALVRRHFHPRPGNHVVDRAPREAPIIGVTAHIEQHMALGLVSVPRGDQPRDHRNHRADILGRARLMGRPQRAQGVHVLMIPADGLFGDRANLAPGFGRPRDDLVIDVGEVAHIGHVIRPVNMAQQPEQHVEHHHRAGVADMGAVVNRGAADIDPHVAVINRGEIFFRPRLAVVKPDPDHPEPLCRRHSPARAWQLQLSLGNRRPARLTLVSR